MITDKESVDHQNPLDNALLSELLSNQLIDITNRLVN